jgi:hypothetical protein
MNLPQDAVYPGPAPFLLRLFFQKFIIQGIASVGIKE